MLTFATGVRVVYKPRAIGLDQAFHAFVAWTGDRGLRPVQRFLRAIDRGDYGWVEAVDQEAFETPSEVRDYYRRAGALLCLTYVLRAKDLHMENVVATRGGPVLIDVELTLQPRPRASTIVPAATAAGEPGVPDHDHCLTSGLLTLVESSGGQVFDIGGLRGTGTGIAVMPGRAWHALETDAIHVTEEKTFAARVGNAVVLDGVVQTPDAFQSELAEGFEAAYRFLMSRRDEILAPEGPLSRFAGQPTRVLARATSQYGALNFVLARPRYQRDGCRWSAALDALNRGLNQSQDRPDVWPMLVAERQALERLDVPHFTVQTDRTAVCAENRELVAGHFGQSGLEAVAERLRRLSDAHLSAELERLKGALAETIHARFTTEPGDDGDDAADATKRGYLTAHALWIARELVARGDANRPRSRMGPPRRQRATAPGLPSASPLRRIDGSGAVSGGACRGHGRPPMVRGGARRPRSAARRRRADRPRHACSRRGRRPRFDRLRADDDRDLPGGCDAGRSRRPRSPRASPPSGLPPTPRSTSPADRRVQRSACSPFIAFHLIPVCSIVPFAAGNAWWRHPCRSSAALPGGRPTGTSSRAWRMEWPASRTP